MAEDPEAPDSAFAGLARAQKAAKLHTLLEKSSKYTDFLFERIRQQQQRARESGPASGASGASGSGEEGGEDPAAKRVPPLFRGELREYQLTGVEWLKALFENGLNGILADEMGLGKTVQVVAFLCHLYAMRVSGPYLIVGPLSTLGNWMAELQRFAPDIPAVLYHGSPEERAALRPGLAQRGKGCGGKTVVTSFEIVMRDRKHLARLPWKYIIVDEGHRLKNLNCKLIRELKTYQSANRLLLSGTPLQNHLAELWSLLNFLLPDIFDDLENFQRWFDIEEMGAADADSHRILEREQESQVLTKLHHILQPFLLRRLKTDVEIAIPPKKELVLYAPMSAQQSLLYNAILNKTILEKLAEVAGVTPAASSAAAPDEAGPTERSPRAAAIRGRAVTGALLKEGAVSEGAGGGSARVRAAAAAGKDDDDDDEVEADGGDAASEDSDFFERMAEEESNRALTLPPDVARGGAEAGIKSVARALEGAVQVNVSLQNILMQLRKVCNHPYLVAWPVGENGTLVNDENLVTASGKLLLLDRLLPRLLSEGHKVLIFSQMTMMLDIIEDYLHLRQIQIKDFNTPGSSVGVFLLSTRAGGLGINLNAADTVIIYDSDWNPQNDLQAQDRCHRIGQTRIVLVYRFVTAHSVEQMVLDRAESKRKLEKLVIHKGKFKGRQKERLAAMTGDELRALLMADAAEAITFAPGELVINDADLTAVLDRELQTRVLAPSAPARLVPEKPASQNLF